MRRKHPPRGDADAAWHDAGDLHGLAFTAPRPLPAAVVQPPGTDAPGTATPHRGASVPGGTAAGSRPRDDARAWFDARAGFDARAPAPAPADGAADPQADAPGRCAHCSACTRFGNCADPVGAGLADSFKLVAHPAGGLGCKAYVPSNVRDGVSHWRLHLPQAVSDLALCPPASACVVRHLHPQALRIEPIAPDEAWPDW